MVARGVLVSELPERPLTRTEKLEQALNALYSYKWDLRRQAEIHDLELYVEDWPGGAS